MKRFLLISLVVAIALFLMSLSFEASAMGNYQATSTHDVRTPLPSPTPYISGVEDLNFSCPVGVPQGYGTVQPDLAWLAACSHCLPTPTLFPTYDFDAVLSPLVCGGGDLSCAVYDEDTIYFTGSTGVSDQARGYFDILGDDLDLVDLYVYYRYAGYTVENMVVGGEGVGVMINQGVEDLPPYENYVSYPVDNLPAMYEYEYNDVPRHNHTVVNALNYQVDQFVQNFGCTRIYVSLSPMSSGDFDTFTCPLASLACVVTDPDTSQTDFEVRQQDFTAGSNTVVTCDPENTAAVDLASYAYCEGTFSMVDNSGVLGYTYNASIRIFPQFSGGVYYYKITGSTTYPTGFYCLSHTGNACQGQFQLNPSATGYYFRYRVSSSAGFTGTFSGSFKIEIQEYPFLDYDCSEADENVLDNSVPLSGQVCASVIPYDDTPSWDFDIFDEGPNSCISVPSVNLYESLPDWLETALTLSFPDFANFLLTYATLPAVTFCTHTVSFENQYFYNVSISLTVLSWAMLAVWLLTRLSRK